MQPQPPANPYTPPAVPHAGSRPSTASLDYFEEDGHLVVRDGSLLPPLCVASGEPASAPPRPRRVHVYPSWLIIVAVFFSPLIAVVLAFALRKTYTVTFSVNPAPQARRRRSMLIGIGVLVVSLIMLIVGPWNGGWPLTLLGFAGFWFGLIWAVAKDRPFVARRAAGQYVYLRLHGAALYEFEQHKARLTPQPVAAAVAPNPNSPF